MNPIVFDTATGTRWNLEIRSQVTLKENTAMVASKVHPRSLVPMMEASAVIV